MTDPAREAERARIARLLYTRLEPAERARLEAEYAALQPDVAGAGSSAAASVGTTSTGGLPVVEPVVEPVGSRSRRLPFVIAATAFLALGVGVGVGWLVTKGTTVVAASASPHAAATSAPPGASAQLDVFYRRQVIAADDSSDIPPVDIGDEYETETLRHLVVVTASTGRTVIANAYAAVRSSDHDICLIVVSRTEFAADSCVDGSDLPDSGIALSVRVGSNLCEVSWLGSGGVEVSVSR